MRFDPDSFTLILEGKASNRDYIQLSDGAWLLQELSPNSGSGKGKNSCVFRATSEESKDIIVKFCRFPGDVLEEDQILRRRRFIREIQAMKRAEESSLSEFLLTLYESGEHSVDGHSFLYYVMEEAEGDLTDFLSGNVIPEQQKLQLCESLLRDLNALHSIGIYHRDLKPDNIFVVKEHWKIGDLGFIAHRTEDEEIDGPRERIGPTGLMSPEAINKAFANLGHGGLVHDCVIDNLSDIFQMAGVFWFILQGTLPTGQIIRADLAISSDRLFNEVLFPMLQYKKERRPGIDDILSHLFSINAEFAA